MPKTKRRMQARPREFVSYIFEIEDWEPHYMFSVNSSKLTQGPYWEHFGLELTGTFLLPEKAKGRKTTFTVAGDRIMGDVIDRPDQTDHKPRGVAFLTMRGTYTEVLTSVPKDALRCIANMLACGRLRFLVLHGEALYRSRAAISSMHFLRRVDPDEY